jgi:hypothetical protein
MAGLTVAYAGNDGWGNNQQQGQGSGPGPQYSHNFVGPLPQRHQRQPDDWDSNQSQVPNNSFEQEGSAPQYSHNFVGPLPQGHQRQAQNNHNISNYQNQDYGDTTINGQSMFEEQNTLNQDDPNYCNNQFSNPNNPDNANKLFECIKDQEERMSQKMLEIKEQLIQHIEDRDVFLTDRIKQDQEELKKNKKDLQDHQKNIKAEESKKATKAKTANKGTSSQKKTLSRWGG